jgi:spermidine/putrescine transport system substrate-binding protein
MRNWMILIIVLALLTGSLSLSTAQDEGWACPEGFEGQTLRVFNWTTYVAENTIPDFEEACGVTIEYFEYGSNEEMLNVVRTESAQYDIVVPTGNTVAIMIQDELLQELDHSKIPNLANVNPTFTEQAFDPGNVYSVPYQWGTIAVAYDQTLVDEPITSWEGFFQYEGRKAWLDDPRAVLGVGLKLLGYDPNSVNEDEINEAAANLLELEQGDVFELAADTGQDLLLRGEVDTVIEYSGDIIQIANECECDDFVYVLPEEGPNIWVDNLAIPFNAPNPELAHAFIDYVLDPQVGADLSTFIGYATPNDAARALLDPEIAENPFIYPSNEILEKGFTSTYVGEAEAFYTTAWNNIRVEFGQAD